MKKNINKLVAFAIGISVMSGSIVPAFAADTALQNTENITNVQTLAKQSSVFTLDDAITAAIANSSTIVLQSKKINLEDDKLDIQDDIDDDGYDYDNQELIVKQEKQKKDFMEDQVAQDTTDKYNDLVAQGKALDKIKKQINIKTKEVSDAQLKKSLGLITSIDLTQAQIDIQTLKNSEKDAENKFKNSQDYFAVLTNKDLSKYTLEQDTNYETFRIDGSVDSYIDDVINKYVEYDKDSYDLFKDHVDDLKDTVSEPGAVPQIGDFLDIVDNTSGTPVVIKTRQDQLEDALDQYSKDTTEYITYLSSKYALSGQSVSLSEKKKSYKNILNTCYSTLLNLENNINVLKSSIELNNKKLSNAKLQYDLGLTTKTQYDNQVVSNDDLETNLRTLIDNYNKLKNNIKKPWTISASTGTTAQ